jgi:hypothetical protein
VLIAVCARGVSPPILVRRRIRGSPVGSALRDQRLEETEPRLPARRVSRCEPATQDKSGEDAAC